MADSRGDDARELIHMRHEIECRGVRRVMKRYGPLVRKALLDEIAAMRQAAAWHRAGQPIRVSVNVSHLQFIRPGFVGRICGMLRDTGAPVGAIEIELTESTAMRDPALTRSNLAALRDVRWDYHGIASRLAE